MKFKYRKIVLAVSVTAMSVGMITLSVLPAEKDSTSIEETGGKVDETEANKESFNLTTKTVSGEAVASKDGSGTDDTDSTDNTGSTGNVSEGDAGTGDNVKEPVMEQNGKKDLTELSNAAGGELQKNAIPEINDLINAYLNAKLACDEEALAKVVNDTSFFDMNDIQKRTEKIEKYKKVLCYTLEGPEEGSYIVYVYEKIKISGIDTLVPSMDKLYVCTNKKGKQYIYVGEIEDKVMNAISEADARDDVTNLIKKVNNEFSKALKEDKKLAKYYEKLSSVTSDTEDKKKDTDQSKADDAQ